ncbi:nuclease-related domain-containing protein [Ornithinibacillus scapharcae]|uniref:nuclease-related domain-containing protein n=1 Tax=Ornithinibacillus scapharcae TaxID=1147159 RepID=UPI000225BE03|nr:nuclease-related domain-containing protein [Ornithinibacillus scapharcae]
MIFNLFKKKKIQKQKYQQNKSTKKTSEKVATRKGEIGEYKIDIQLSQLPKEYLYINDLMIENTKSITGYSQIDHLVISPYGIFVIETKNYQGTIYGGKNRKTWLVNGKFKMLSPLVQNFGHIEALKNYIEPKYYDKFISIVSFTKRCTLKIDLELRDIKSNEMVIYDIFLTETIQRKVSMTKLKQEEPLLSEKDCQTIYDNFMKVNIFDPEIRKKHNESIKEKKDSVSSKDSVKSKSTCVVCDKVVSQKVVAYCKSNKRFNGKIYCFDHQKSI